MFIIQYNILVIIVRIKTGIFGLDDLLGGGYLSNSINIVLGSTGTGKTIFSLQYLKEGLRNGEKGIFVSFDMEELDILDAVSSLGWDREIADYIERDRLSINKFYVENITYLNEDLLNFISTSAEEKTRIVIDSFTPLVSSLGFEDRNDVNWFFTNLKKLGTTVITLEEHSDQVTPATILPTYLANNVMNIRNLGYGEAFNRTLRILKHRGSWHAEGVFPYRILRGFGIFIEGAEEVPESRKKVNLEEILKKNKIKKKDIDEELLEKLEKFVEEPAEGAEDVIEKALSQIKK